MSLSEEGLQSIAPDVSNPALQRNEPRVREESRGQKPMGTDPEWGLGSGLFFERGLASSLLSV